LKACIQTLLYSVGGDGNLLLNVGPMPTGEIELRQASRLRQIGAWLAKYGGGVYGTRGGPFIPGDWGVSTCKGDKIYLYIMDWPGVGPLLLQESTSRLRAIARFPAARPKSSSRPATSRWISPESTATPSPLSSS
jgi:hypothetical protein